LQTCIAPGEEQYLAQSKQPALHWRVYLARRAPRRVAVCLLAALAAGTAAYALWGLPWVAAAAAGLVLCSVSDFLLPLHYRIDERGVTCSGLLSLRRLEWPRVRRCCRDGRGIKVSPLPAPSRLEAYRGIYLWLDGNEQEVVAALRHYRGEAT